MRCYKICELYDDIHILYMFFFFWRLFYGKLSTDEQSVIDDNLYVFNFWYFKSQAAD